MMEARRLVRAGARQVRPSRPRPASCWSATTTVRSAAPRSASAKATDWVESTVPRRTMTPDVLPPGVIEPAEARDELGAHGFLLDETLSLLRDDLGGRAPPGSPRPPLSPPPPPPPLRPFALPLPPPV